MNILMTGGAVKSAQMTASVLFRVGLNAGMAF